MITYYNNIEILSLGKTMRKSGVAIHPGEKKKGSAEFVWDGK